MVRSLQTVMLTNLESKSMSIFQQIVDVDTGKSLGPNRSGEIWLKGPQVATGYLNLPAHNKDTFLKDGWVRTGKK